MDIINFIYFICSRWFYATG